MEPDVSHRNTRREAANRISRPETRTRAEYETKKKENIHFFNSNIADIFCLFDVTHTSCKVAAYASSPFVQSHSLDGAEKDEEEEDDDEKEEENEKSSPACRFLLFLHISFSRFPNFSFPVDSPLRSSYVTKDLLAEKEMEEREGKKREMKERMRKGMRKSRSVEKKGQRRRRSGSASVIKTE